MSDESTATLLYTVRERETETRGKQLLDVWAADILVLLDLDNPKDLKASISHLSVFPRANEMSDERESNGSGHDAGQPCPDRGS